MYSSFDSSGGGSSALNRYSLQLATLERQRRAETALTEMRVHAERIATALNDVIRQNKLETEHISNMNYELRTLMTAILGFSQMMTSEAHGPMPEAYRDYAGDIANSGEEMLTVLKNFQDQSDPPDQVETPAAILNESEISLVDLIREAYRELKSPADRKSVVIKARMARGLPQVLGDKPALLEAIRCLLGNSIAIAPEQSEIDLAASVTQDGELVLQLLNASTIEGDSDNAWLIADMSGIDRARGTLKRHDGEITITEYEDHQVVSRMILPASRAIGGPSTEQVAGDASTSGSPAPSTPAPQASAPQTSAPMPSSTASSAAEPATVHQEH